MAKPATPAQVRFWNRKISQQARSGLTHREFCRKHDLSLHQFRGWKYRNRPRRIGRRPRPGAPAATPQVPAAPAFLPLRLVGPGLCGGGALELLLAPGRILRIPSDFDAATLRRVLGALEERPC